MQQLTATGEYATYTAQRQLVAAPDIKGSRVSMLHITWRTGRLPWRKKTVSFPCKSVWADAWRPCGAESLFGEKIFQCDVQKYFPRFRSMLMVEMGVWTRLECSVRHISFGEFPRKLRWVVLFAAYLEDIGRSGRSGLIVGGYLKKFWLKISFLDSSRTQPSLNTIGDFVRKLIS